MIQEEMNQKIVTFIFRTGQLTWRELEKAFAKYMASTKNPKKDTTQRGKITYKKLMEQNAGATSIEVDKSGIKDFNHIARKYHIDYAVKKDPTMDPPKYMVFFKGRDQDSMTMAFKQYVAYAKKKNERPSFRQKLEKFKKLSKSQDKNREREKNRQKDRGQSL